MSLDVGDLRYRTGRATDSLPPWATFLIAVGQYAANWSEPSRRLVIGISLPTRRYAAALTALGVTSAAYVDPESMDPRAHFEWLASLPVGTPLRYRHGVHLHCGELIGTEEIAGDAYLALQANTKYMRRWDMSLDIQPLEPEEEFVRRRTLVANPEFVNAALPGIDPLAHASYTSLDCLVVGVKESLRIDVLDERFVAHGSEGATKGVLNDILRCDAFENNSNDHDRTTVLSPFINDVPERLLEQAPPAVVFDGGHGFLRVRSNWRNTAWVVLLDRSSSIVAAAAAAFNQELAMSIEDADMSALGSVPPELEVIAFVAASR